MASAQLWESTSQKSFNSVESGSHESMLGEALCHLVIDVGVINKRSLFKEIRIYLSQNGGVPTRESYHKFSTSQVLRYTPLCDDFGPFNASNVFRFIEIFDKHINAKTTRQGSDKQPILQNIVHCVDPGRRALTNAAFLLGAYMILKLNMTPTEILSRFGSIEPRRFEPYRDSSFGAPVFHLELIDCWQALERGKQNGWIGIPTIDKPTCWGMIDSEEYDHYDNPFNSDLHAVLPGKIVVFRGPKLLGGQKFCDDFVERSFAKREFSPEYYLDILISLGVVAVVRLNGPQYDKNIFESNGIQLFDLACDPDNPIPPPATISRFFKIMNETNGCVAIHGRASLGRAGTLVALYVMRTYNFTAREAIAWVRIMRPGSIVGIQQQYLCKIEACIRDVMVSVAAVLTCPRNDKNGRTKSCIITQACCIDSKLGQDKKVEGHTKQSQGTPSALNFRRAQSMPSARTVDS